MAISSRIQDEVQGSIARVVDKFRNAAAKKAALITQRERMKEEDAEIYRRNRVLWDTKNAQARKGRTEAALKGLDTLFALCSIQDLHLLRNTDASNLRSGGFLYYLAADHQEHVAVGIYPDLVILEVGGCEAQYHAYIEISSADSEETRYGKIEEIISIQRRYPIAILADFDQPGDNGDLLDLAFQVLVDASKENRLREYLAAITKMWH